MVFNTVSTNNTFYLMDLLKKLDELESKTINLVDQTGEMMNLLGLELKKQHKANQIQFLLTSIVEQIQDISDELHDNIDNLA